MKRRQFMNHSATVMSLAMTAGLIPCSSFAQSTERWNRAAFETKNLKDAVKALDGLTAVVSSDVLLEAPEIAENGNVVRMKFESKLPRTTMLALLIEKNPNVLSAVFEMMDSTTSSFAINVKIAQSSNVYALAKVGDKFYYAVKEVKVTIGGCGG